MNDAITVLGAAAIWLLVVVSPGPNFLVVSQLALARSRRASMGATLGIAIGALTYASLTVFGLSLVVAEMAWLHDPIRLAGGAYLVYLGIRSWRGARDPVARPDEATMHAGDFREGVRTGLVTALTNPKAIAFFVGFFAAAVPAGAPVGVKLAVLGAGAAIELGWYSIVGTTLSASPLRTLYLRAKTAIDRAIGGVLVLLGLRLLLDRR